MELVFEKIRVPHQHSFLARKLELNHHSTKIHSHKNYELNLITAGSGKRLVGDHISTFNEGDLVLMGPHLPHCWEILSCQKKTTPSCIVIHFYENIIGSDFFNVPELKCIEKLLGQSARGIYFHGSKARDVQAEMETLVESNGLDSYITLLKIFKILLSFEDREYLSIAPYSQDFRRELDRINIVYQYVLQNIRDGISQAEAADLLHMAPGSFCRYFRKKTKMSFMQFVKNTRINFAARLIAESDMRISQICFECGYNNIANFNHHFKSLMGMTPTAYRKRLTIRED